MTGLQFIRELARSTGPLQLGTLAVAAGGGCGVVGLILARDAAGWASLGLAVAGVLLSLALVLAVYGSRHVQEWIMRGGKRR